MFDQQTLRIRVFANPHASGISELGAAIGHLVNMRHDLCVVFSKSDAHLAEQLATLSPNNADVVAIAGGDGTISRSAGALARCGLPLLVLPLGTANDFARSLDIPRSPIEAANLLAIGRQIEVDIGVIAAGENLAQKRKFLNAIGLGLSATVSQAQDNRLKGVLGGLSYAITTLQNVGSLAVFDTELVLDGVKQTVSATQITIGNGMFFGGGLRISDDASLQNGLLQGYIIGDVSPAELITLGPRVKLGRLGDHPAITKLTAKRITIRCKTPLAVNVDGDIFAQAPAELSIQPERLRVFTV